MCFENYCSFSGLERMPNVKMKFRQNYLAHEMPRLSQLVLASLNQWRIQGGGGGSHGS